MPDEVPVPDVVPVPDEDVVELWQVLQFQAGLGVGDSASAMLFRSVEDSDFNCVVPIPPTLPLIAAEICDGVLFCTPVGVWQFRQLLINRFLSAVVIVVRAAADIIRERACVAAADLVSIALAVKL